MNKTISKEISQRVKKLRDHKGLSQQELAKLLMISRPTVSLIESGERKISADELVKLAEIFNISVESLLDFKKEPKVILEESKKNESLKDQIRINVPQKNLEKFREVLLHILNKIGSKSNIGETVIYKLLYFIDFDFYEKYEEQLIGATYLKNNYGPTPIEFKKIVDKMIEDKEIEKIKSKYFSYPQVKYLPLRRSDLTKLKASEVEIIDQVLDKLSDMNASQISEYSHNDVPWLVSEDSEYIEYETVFYRKSPYSVREYSSEDI
jgi:transcriptional regulator with XRE-family HTH domain